MEAHSDSAVLADHQKLQGIESPTDHDVLSGRGVTTNRHLGNVNFRNLVSLNKELYVTSSKRQKMAISKSVVEAVRSMDPPGRFLEKDPISGLWNDIGHKKAIEKTSQALRDGAALLRKQLSADLGDPDFLQAVFDGDERSKSSNSDGSDTKDSADKTGGKHKGITAGKENNTDKSKLPEKAKGSKAKAPAKKVHRARSKSIPSPGGSSRAKHHLRKLSEAQLSPRKRSSSGSPTINEDMEFVPHTPIQPKVEPSTPQSWPQPMADGTMHPPPEHAPSFEHGPPPYYQRYGGPYDYHSHLPPSHMHYPGPAYPPEYSSPSRPYWYGGTGIGYRPSTGYYPPPGHIHSAPVTPMRQAVSPIPAPSSAMSDTDNHHRVFMPPASPGPPLPPPSPSSRRAFTPPTPKATSHNRPERKLLPPGQHNYSPNGYYSCPPPRFRESFPRSSSQSESPLTLRSGSWSLDQPGDYLDEERDTTSSNLTVPILGGENPREEKKSLLAPRVPLAPRSHAFSCHPGAFRRPPSRDGPQPGVEFDFSPPRSATRTRPKDSTFSPLPLGNGIRSNTNIDRFSPATKPTDGTLTEEKKTEEVDHRERSGSGTSMTEKKLKGLSIQVPTDSISKAPEDEERSSPGAPALPKEEFVREDHVGSMPEVEHPHVAESEVDDIDMSPIPFDHEDPTTLMQLPDSIMQMPIAHDEAA